jgi:hypothetical protein
MRRQGSVRPVSHARGKDEEEWHGASAVRVKEVWPIPRREAKSKRLGSATARVEVAESVRDVRVGDAASCAVLLL